MGDISIMGLPFNTVILMKNATNWYESPLFSGLIGVVVGFALTGIRDYFKGKKELNQYEYFLLSKAKDVLHSNSEIIEEKIDELVDELRSDLRPTKVASSRIIFDSLLKARKGEDYSEGIGKINDRLINLRGGGRFF